MSKTRMAMPSEEQLEFLLLRLRPTLSKRLLRQIFMCLNIGVARRKDPEGVYMLPGTCSASADRDPPVQICFSFDTTGSMSSYIVEVRTQIEALVSRLLIHIPGVQVSIAAHGDYGDESNYVVKAKDFSDDVQALRTFVGECGNTGGGDCPECYELVMHKMQELSWAATSAKALVMIGDAPPHGQARYKELQRTFIDWRKEAEWYAERDIHVYGIKCGGSKESFYNDIAKITGALVIPIQDMDLMPELFTELCFREQQRWALAVHPPAPWDVRTIADPKAALLNVCGSCLLAEPNFHERVSVTKDRIRRLCRRLALEGCGEFVLQMALYARTQLYLRSVSNYLAALATKIPNCQRHLKSYFPHLVKLPTDMLEVVKMTVSLDGDTAVARKRFLLPRSLRNVCSKKFADFSEYQLAKHNKAERLQADGTWMSATTSSKNGKHAGQGKKEREDEGNSNAEQKEGPVLSMKSLVKLCHITEPHELVMKVLGKRYPADEDGFVDSGLPGTFDTLRAEERMRLKVPLTFQTELSKTGNTKESWEKLIDNKGLPFMAMLRNLRNILGADISEAHHQILLARLQDAKQIEQSMQMPHRFLTAFLAIDAAVKGKSFGKGKGKGKHGYNEDDNSTEPKLLPISLADGYRQALDQAVRLSVKSRLPVLDGRTVVLCDVSGSMRYNDFAISAKGVGGVTSAADLAILMGLLLFGMAKDGPANCRVALFSDGPSSPNQLQLEQEGSLLGQFKAVKEKVTDMGKSTELPMKWLEETLSDFQADRLVLLSDMLIGQTRNHPGGGGKLQELFVLHRKTKPHFRFVCVDLCGRGATAGIDHTGDSGDGDILLSGFSENMLKYIANPNACAQVQDVEGILDEVIAEKAAAAADKGQRRQGSGKKEADSAAASDEQVAQ